MTLNGFNSITWATGIKATVTSQQRTNKKPITLNYWQEYESHRCANFSQCSFRERVKIFLGAFAASRRAKTTISQFPNWCCCVLKFSLVERFILFLSTARLIFFFAIASPNLAWLNLFWIAKTVKNLSVVLNGLAKTFWYSSGLFSFNWDGKQWPFSINLHCQTSTTFCSSGINHSPAAFCCHSCAKTMCSFAFNFAGLICSFHLPKIMVRSS